MRATFDTRQFVKILNNTVKYSQGFIDQANAQETLAASQLASTSISAFYDYLDLQARMNPGMLHHVYEWGQVGNPGARLVELKKKIAGGAATISADFTQSSSVSDTSTEPFYDKARIMEDGIAITIDEVDAQALFFESGGAEYFRMGPITIENPGGEGVRGSFVAAFQEFYNVYFNEVYLRSIRYYEHFSNPKQYEAGFGAVMGGNAYGAGKAAAQSWLLSAPGDYSE